MDQILTLMAQKDTALTVTQVGEEIRACLICTSPNLQPSERLSISLQGPAAEVATALADALTKQIPTPMKQIYGGKPAQTPKPNDKKDDTNPIEQEAKDSSPLFNWEY